MAASASGAPRGRARRAGSAPPAPRCGASACWSAARIASAAYPPAEALEPLFCQTYHRDDPALEYRTLGFLDALLRAVPVCRLSCGMTEDAVRCSFEAMTGLTYESERRPDEGCEEGSVFA